jgi:hypothetical protein
VIQRADRELVRARARYQCEYCGLEQALVPLVMFHIEHIVPRQHGGGDEIENLALACYHCNLDKGPNLTGIDPDVGSIAPLFNPRREMWNEHFAQRESVIVGLTPTGRATVRVLNMNGSTRIELRSELGRSRG